MAHTPDPTAERERAAQASFLAHPLPEEALMQTGVHPAPGGPWALVLSSAHAQAQEMGVGSCSGSPARPARTRGVPLRAQDAGLRPGSCMNGPHGAACGDHRALPQLVPAHTSQGQRGGGQACARSSPVPLSPRPRSLMTSF